MTSRQARRCGFREAPEMELLRSNYARNVRTRPATPYAKPRNTNMKRFLLALLLSSGLAATPALAWEGPFKFVNHATTWPPVFIANGIIFTANDGPHTVPLNDIGPQQAQKFLFLKYSSVWVTVTSEYVAPVSTTVLCDLTTQNTFKLRQNSAGAYVLECSNNPGLVMP